MPGAQPCSELTSQQVHWWSRPETCWLPLGHCPGDVTRQPPSLPGDTSTYLKGRDRSWLRRARTAGAPCAAHLLVGLFLERNVLLGKGESCVTSIFKTNGRAWGSGVCLGFVLGCS